MSTQLRVPADTLARQAEAANPENSVWVSANAGSGKTHVLAQRVVRLLLAGTDPARILCLTYTRAAAANMANRVFQTLSRWAVMPEADLAEAIATLEGTRPLPERLRESRRLFARALETPGGLKIQTLHAFCEAILHQFTLEANIAGHFELMDQGMEEALVGEARRAMIAAASGGGEAELAEAFAEVIDAGGESGLETLLAEIVRRRDALRAFIDAMGDADAHFATLFGAFGLAHGAHPDDAAATVLPDPYFDLELARAIAKQATAARKSIAAQFAEALAAALALGGGAATLEALEPLFLKREGGVRHHKSATRIMAKGVGEHFPGFHEEFERFAGTLDEACDRASIIAMVRDTRAALVMADWLIGRYERLKSARGFLDFNDLIARTVNLLARPDASAWVHYKLDRGIDHILIDEAQDTSPGQWQVVKSLAEEFFAGKGQRDELRRTLFAVGDEKQSIYSFQGAEPEAFFASGRDFQRRVRDSGRRFAFVRLDRSFRSTEDVLAAVDRVFARDEVRKGLTRDPEAIRHSAVRESVPGCVELWPSLAPRAVEAPDDWTQSIDHASAPAVRLATRVADTVAGWLAAGERIEATGRTLTPGDVLVLVRKRDSFVHALSRELKNRHVPVAGADRLALADHIAVRDLMAVGRFVLQPDDDLSLAAVLKSPLLGLDEDGLMRLAMGRGGLALFDRLRDVAATDPALAPLLDKLARWRNEAGYGTAFAFYADILARDGGRRAMIARLGHEAGDILDEFLKFCLATERTSGPDLETLLALLEGGGPVIKRELDQARGELRIMTAHAAKGLEAHVVFLVDGGGAPHHDSHLPVLMPFDPPAGTVWLARGLLWRTGGGNANSVLRALSEETRRKAEEEYRRLLYVGMTRAEDRLIVCGYHGASGQRDMTWHAIVRDALTGAAETSEHPNPATGDTILRFRVNAPGAIEAEAVPSAGAESVRALPGLLLERVAPAPALPRPLSPSGAGALVEPGPSMGEAGSPVLDARRTGAFAAERGTAAHRLLQMLPDLDPAERMAAAERYLDRVGRDWPEGERRNLWRSVGAILEDGRFAPLFAAGARAEVSVMGTVAMGDARRAIAGKIDRLVVGPDKVLIVDFKTSRPPVATLGAVPAGHVAQMALYRALLRQVYPSHGVEAALVYTELPCLIALPGDLMDRALVDLAQA